MKLFLYLLSGIIFAIGLSISGMIDPVKVKSFLAVGFDDWSPALLFVLSTAVIVYLISFLVIRWREKTLNGTRFYRPAMRSIDSKLIIGAILFGIGWGIVGICPGPALVHLAFLDVNFLIFLGTMILGFELQRRFT